MRCRQGFARKRKLSVGSTIRRLSLCVRMRRQRGFQRELVAAWRQSVKVSQQTTPAQHTPICAAADMVVCVRAHHYRRLWWVSTAITSAYPQEHLSMAALPSLYQVNAVSAAVDPRRRSGETPAKGFVTPKRTQFVAVPPPPRGSPVDGGGDRSSSGDAHVLHRPEVAGGRRRGAGPRARRYSDGGSALSGVGVSPRAQPPQSALVSNSTRLPTLHTRRHIILSLA